MKDLPIGGDGGLPNASAWTSTALIESALGAVLKLASDATLPGYVRVLSALVTCAIAVAIVVRSWDITAAPATRLTRRDVDSGGARRSSTRGRER